MSAARMRPDRGPLDDAAIVETFLTELGQGSDKDRIMSQVWREGGYLQVRREPPRAGEGGKILHLHLVSRTPARPVAC